MNFIEMVQHYLSINLDKIDNLDHLTLHIVYSDSELVDLCKFQILFL